jgi:tetratricopeptide (TPR) repeat protein
MRRIAGSLRSPGSLLLALTFLGAGAGAESKGDLPGRWLEAKSDNFIVVGNATEKQVVQAVQRFEEVRSHFLSVAPSLAAAATRPLRVYLARDEATLKRLMPSLIAERGSGSVGGRFVNRPTLQFVQIVNPADRDWRDQIVSHEYFHFLAHRSGLRLPVWLDEGLADFWAATDFMADRRVVGRALDHRLAAARRGPLLPIERLLAVDRSSAEYRNRESASVFYAQSWGLTHYLRLGEKGAREAQLRRYVELVSAQRESVAAAREAFGDLAALEDGLRRHLNATLFPMARMGPVAQPDATRISIRELSQDDAAAAVLLALLHTDPTSSFQALIPAAATGEPTPVKDLAAALLAVRERKFQPAFEAFDRASRSAEPEPLALYGLARLRELVDPSVDSTAKAESELRRALGIEPGYAPANARLAELMLRRQGEEEQALQFARRARLAHPDDTFLELLELRGLDRVGRTGEVQARLARIVEGALGSRSPIYLNNLCWFGTLGGYSKQVLPLCDLSLKLEPKAAATLDSRGVARSIAGEFEGAAEDLRAALAADSSRWNEDQLATRRAWIAALAERRNPIDDQELERLRRSPDESFSWGY